MARVAGAVLLISVLCFFIGASRPVVLDYFGAGSRVEQMRIVRDNPDEWQFANRMMDTGVAIAPIGFLLLALVQIIGRKRVAVVLPAIAAAFFVWRAAAIWNSSAWTFPRFTLPMTAGIVLLGFVIWRYSRWGGALTIGMELVTVLMVYIVLRDVPPGAHFAPLLIAAMTLVFFD